MDGERDWDQERKRQRAFARRIYPDQDADDVAHEIILQMLAFPAQFEKHARIDAVRHYYGKKMVNGEIIYRHEIPSSEQKDLGGIAPDLHFDPLLKQILLAAFNTLTEQQAAVLTLWMRDGLNPAEIGRSLGIGKNAAHSSQRCALARLRRYLDIQDRRS